MCQTTVISRHLGRIGRRSYDRRLRMASPLYVEKRGEVARLLNEVDLLSDRLHDEFITITEDDYRSNISLFHLILQGFHKYK